LGREGAGGVNPDRIAALVRELVQTPDHELGHFARRAGLHSQPRHEDLMKARELLQSVVAALESGSEAAWDRVGSGWTGMRGKHHAVASPAAAGAPKPPAWIVEAVPKPSLGDPAPGTEARGELDQDRARFVPAARPQFVPQGPAAEAAAPAPEPPVPPAPFAAPMAPAVAPAAPAPEPPAPPAPFADAVVQVDAGAPAPQASPRRAPPPPRRTAVSGPTGAEIETSLAKYAAFCAACAGFPDRVPDTEQQYGIVSPQHRRYVDDTWQDRMDTDPSLQEQWEELFARFRSQLR